MSGREELRRRLRQAEDNYRKEKEIHEKMLNHGQELERLIEETESENKLLNRKVEELQKQVTILRKRREEEENEEALQEEYFSEEESIEEESQSMEIRKMADQLSLGETQEEVKNLERAEHKLKKKLEEIQENLKKKDEELQTKTTTIIKQTQTIKEHFNTIKELRQDEKKLLEQLWNRQEHTTRKTRQKPVSLAKDEDEDQGDKFLKTTNWWSCAKGLWKGVKVAGTMALCVLLPLGVMASECYNPHPNYSLWDIALDLMEPYGQLHHTDPPVY